MSVTKSGRTTGVTQGTVIATHVNGVQINYGTQANPLIAVFNDTIQVRSAQGSFSRPGDSGSVILDAQTLHEGVPEADAKRATTEGPDAG